MNGENNSIPKTRQKKNKKKLDGIQPEIRFECMPICYSVCVFALFCLIVRISSAYAWVYFYYELVFVECFLLVASVFRRFPMIQFFMPFSNICS